MTLDDKAREEVEGFSEAELDRMEHMSYSNIQNGRYRTNCIKAVAELLDSAGNDEHRLMILTEVILAMTGDVMNNLNIRTIDVERADNSIRAILIGENNELSV